MHCIIIDEDERAIRRLEKLISKISFRIDIDQVLYNLDDAIRYLQQHPSPDIIFMEIQFSEGYGIGIFKHCNVDCPVIITSASPIQGFDFPPTLKIVYLSKPINLENLQNTLMKIKLQKVKFYDPDITEKSHESIEIRFGKKNYVTKWSEVAYITKQENMSFIIRNDGLKLPVNLSFKKIKSNLPVKNFTPIDHCTFVNVSAIRSISRKDGKKMLHLSPELNSVLEIHPNFDESFMKWLKENQV